MIQKVLIVELKKIKYIGDLMRAVPVEWLGSSLMTEMTRVEFIIQFVTNAASCTMPVLILLQSGIFPFA